MERKRRKQEDTLPSAHTSNPPHHQHFGIASSANNLEHSEVIQWDLGFTDHRCTLWWRGSSL